MEKYYIVYKDEVSLRKKRKSNILRDFCPTILTCNTHCVLEVFE